MSPAWVHVPDILPLRQWPDASRPNAQMGATPLRAALGDEPQPMGDERGQDYPLYRVLKKCRDCATTWIGHSFRPQYDDETEPQYGYCEGCIDRREAEFERADEVEIRMARERREVELRRRAEDWAVERQARKEAAQRLAAQVAGGRERPTGFTR